MHKMKAAVFASGNGSNFGALMNYKDLACEIVLLVCDKPDASVIDKAIHHNVQTFVLNPRDYDTKEEYETHILKTVKGLEVEWIFLAGYMRLIGPTLLDAYEGRILNIHPSLLPAFPGKNAIGQAILAGCKTTGVTVHYIDEGMDTGPIIAQAKVEIFPNDTEETLKVRIQEVEHSLYPEVINKVVERSRVMKRRALISVSDKRNVVEFAMGLANQDYEIISTGGTLKTLREAGIPAIPIDMVTDFPEILDGRVKTLHPLVHGGLLAKRSNPDHLKQLEENKIQPIDLVVVNLYPFKQTVERIGVSKEEIIENIDIGGPTMLRSAAKNFMDVLVVVDPDDYEMTLQKLELGTMDLDTRQRFAAKVFRHTANYDAMIASYFLTQTKEEFPETYTVTYEKVQSLRYGENPHQKAAFYRNPIQEGMSLATAKQLHGKELSYNNIQDANAAIEILAEYEGATAVAVKHMNPCGIGTGESLVEAFQAALDADPVSIFGGIIALNREVDMQTAEKLRDIFLEIIIAPSFSEKALEILTAKKNIRLIAMEMSKDNKQPYKLTTVDGGMLIQHRDQGNIHESDIEVVTKVSPSKAELMQLLFAWKAVKHVKSNAIVLAKDNQTVGIGAGQMNRVGAARIAIEQAGPKAKGAVMASDAFFPMPDTVEEAIKAGVRAIIQPGGSKRDQDSIDVCNQHGIAMVFTGMRHFKH